jgi:hypothetical protein
MKEYTMQPNINTFKFLELFTQYKKQKLVYYTSHEIGQLFTLIYGKPYVPTACSSCVQNLLYNLNSLYSVYMDKYPNYKEELYKLENPQVEEVIEEEHLTPTVPKKRKRHGKK